jgi:hypothetical protein
MNQEYLRSVIKILRLDLDTFRVSFPYNLAFIERIKPINSQKWQPNGICCPFPNTAETLEKILRVFEDQKVYIDPVLQTSFSPRVISRGSERRELTPKQSHLD